MCVEEIKKQSHRPDVDESEQFGVLDVRGIFQSLKKVVESGQKLPALVALSGRKEQHHDAVFEDPGDLALRVELILVPVVLHQNSVQEQVHHDGRGTGKVLCGEDVQIHMLDHYPVIVHLIAHIHSGSTLKLSHTVGYH